MPKKQNKNLQIVPVEIIKRKIFLIRGRKVMLDSDLAELYGVETKVLNQAVKRNLDRFPNDFMFQLVSAEKVFLKSQFAALDQQEDMRSQFVTASKRNIRFSPYAFTQEGVAMLSSVLRSQRAIQVNIAIMRTFVKLMEFLANHKKLALKLEKLERKYDSQFRVVFEAIRKLMEEEEKPKTKIGF